MRSNRGFRQSVPAVSAGITGLLKGLVPNLRFVFSGPPRTNGQTVWVGDLPQNAEETVIRMLWGHVLHEVGHILYTDFDALNAFLNTQTALFAGCQNGLEDVYLEKKLISTFKGAFRWLADSIEIMQQRSELTSGTSSASKALAVFPLFFGSVEINGFEVEREELEATRQSLVDWFNETGVARLEGLLMQRLPACESTHDTLQLTEDYLDLAREIEQEQEQEQEQDENQGQDPNSNSDQDQGDDADSASSDGDPGDSQGGACGNDSDDGDDSSGTDAGGTKAKPSVFDDENDDDLASSPIDFGSALEDVADENIQTNAGQGDHLKAGDSGDFSGRCSRPSQPNAGRYNELRSETSGMVNAMSNRLVRLMAKARAPRRKTSSQGRLRPSKTHRVFSGDQRFYRRTTYDEVPQSAVSLVVDLSGSMMGSPERMASTVLIALAEALHRAQIAFEATCFGDDFWVMKGFNESYTNLRGHFGSLDQAISGTTPLGQAMHESALRLVRQPERRKIMIVLTDGYPDDPELVTDIDRRLRVDGVDVLAIGIESRSVEHNFAKYAVVQDLSDLGPALLSELTPRLIKAA